MAALPSDVSFDTPAPVVTPTSSGVPSDVNFNSPPEDSSPMPGPIDSLVAGIKHGIGTVQQTAQTVEGKTPDADQDQPSPASAGWEMRDLLEPSRGLSKLTYQLGESSPTLASGVLGGIAGGAADDL